MGLLYPENCKASHLNAPEGTAPSFWNRPFLALQHLLTPYAADEQAALQRYKFHHKEGLGYDHLQKTKPQTLAYALADSPVGLLAWIYETLHDWTDAYPWTDDEILTWVSISWHSTAGARASSRINYESIHNGADGVHYNRILEYILNVNFGIAHFYADAPALPNIWAAALGNVVLQTRNPRGGHFAALEQPEVIVRDLQTMLRRGGRAYGCVSGLDGYDEARNV